MNKTETNEITIGGFKVGGGAPLFVIAGPCVIEGEKECLSTAERLKRIAEDVGLPLIFKSSFDKANRSSAGSYRGPGLKKGLEILGKVKSEYDLPLLSDVHRLDELEPAAEVLDILQIPAFLCRQTDMITGAATTGKVVNIKKGQFMAPWDMKNVVEKARSTGNDKIILTERGASFGYNNLVTDMRAFPILRSYGCPTVFDATHAVQLPGAAGGSSGGQREFATTLARAAAGAGIDGIFLEVHENPDEALCDGANSLFLSDVSGLLITLKAINSIVSAAEGDVPSNPAFAGTTS